ncbi:MAG TPA: methionine synthase [Terriglobia bacterium]|nr:methionine synthase [Terriglobia bacterium]
MLKTLITGSLPKPPWLSDPTVQLFAPWVVPPDRLSEAQDDAVRLAVENQEAAGLDILTDGEQRRRHYIWGFVGELEGIDTEHLGKKMTRGGRYSNRLTPVARIVGEVVRSKQILVEGLRYAKTLTTRPIKVTMPGPMTIVDSLLDDYYGQSESALAMRFATMLNAEARDLAAAGAAIIQFDEPCFNIYVDKVADWGIAALDRCIQDVAATTAVHICYGYGVPAALSWKSQNKEWGHYGTTLPLLAKSPVNQVSIECAASGVDVSIVEAIRGKDVLVGVIDVGTNEVESPDLVAQRIRKALPYVDPEHLYPTTDCGLVPRPRDVARGKMQALAKGAAIVREGLG